MRLQRYSKTKKDTNGNAPLVEDSKPNDINRESPKPQSSRQLTWKTREKPSGRRATNSKKNVQVDTFSKDNYGMPDFLPSSDHTSTSHETTSSVLSSSELALKNVSQAYQRLQEQIANWTEQEVSSGRAALRATQQDPKTGRRLLTEECKLHLNRRKLLQNNLAHARAQLAHLGTSRRCLVEEMRAIQAKNRESEAMLLALEQELEHVNVFQDVLSRDLAQDLIPDEKNHVTTWSEADLLKELAESELQDTDQAAMMPYLNFPTGSSSIHDISASSSVVTKLLKKPSKIKKTKKAVLRSNEYATDKMRTVADTSITSQKTLKKKVKKIKEEAVAASTVQGKEDTIDESIRDSTRGRSPKFVPQHNSHDEQSSPKGIPFDLTTRDQSVKEICTAKRPSEHPEGVTNLNMVEHPYRVHGSSHKDIRISCESWRKVNSPSPQDACQPVPQGCQPPKIKRKRRKVAKPKSLQESAQGDIVKALAPTKMKAYSDKNGNDKVKLNLSRSQRLELRPSPGCTKIERHILIVWKR